MRSQCLNGAPGHRCHVGGRPRPRLSPPGRRDRRSERRTGTPERLAGVTDGVCAGRTSDANGIAAARSHPPTHGCRGGASRFGRDRGLCAAVRCAGLDCMLLARAPSVLVNERGPVTERFGGGRGGGSRVSAQTAGIAFEDAGSFYRCVEFRCVVTQDAGVAHGVVVGLQGAGLLVVGNEAPLAVEALIVVGVAGVQEHLSWAGRHPAGGRGRRVRPGQHREPRGTSGRISGARAVRAGSPAAGGGMRHG